MLLREQANLAAAVTRFPKGSSKGGQFAPGKGGGSPGGITVSKGRAELTAARKVDAKIGERTRSGPYGVGRKTTTKPGAEMKARNQLREAGETSNRGVAGKVIKTGDKRASKIGSSTKVGDQTVTLRGLEREPGGENARVTLSVTGPGITVGGSKVLHTATYSGTLMKDGTAVVNTRVSAEGTHIADKGTADFQKRAAVKALKTWFKED